MKPYLIVEGRSDAAIMRPLLSAANLADVPILVGGGKSPAMSLAKSIAMARGDHVAVLVDADTRDERLISEQRRTFFDLQAPASLYTRLFLGVPTVEEALFPDALTFMRIFKVAMTERQAQKFEVDRMSVIQSYISKPEGGEPQVISRGILSPALARVGFGRPLLEELFAFLRIRSPDSSA